MNGLSLCAGIGGLELGLRLAVPGYRCVGYCERDAYAAATLVARMEDEALDRAPIWDDLATFPSDLYRGKVDLISAGFPCQPFSVAGKRKGTDDARWIWGDIARIIRDVGPRYVFLENVPGLLANSGGFGTVLGDLAELGFDAEWDVFSAAGVGAPHLRRRLFILAQRIPDTSGDSLRLKPERGASRAQATDSGDAEPGYVGEAMAGSRDATGPPRQHLRRGRPVETETVAVGGGEGLAFTPKRGRGTLRQPPGGNRLADGGGEGVGDPSGARPRQYEDGGGEPREGREDPKPAGDDLPNPESVQRQAIIGGEPDGITTPFPPGPSDRAGWADALQRDPSVEPAIRGVANGIPARVDRLRCCGNGVVPVVAAVAFRTLAARHGIPTPALLVVE